MAKKKTEDLKKVNKKEFDELLKNVLAVPPPKKKTKQKKKKTL